MNSKSLVENIDNYLFPKITMTRLILKAFSTFMLIALGFLLQPENLQAQTISGTINTTASAVTAQSLVANTITLNSASGFAVNDKILLIQMNGATIDLTSNNASFGTVTAYANTGKYEILTVCDVTGNVLKFDKTMANSYDVSAKVQAVKIEQYTNVTVTGTLSATAWNGTTGGVLAMEVSGTLTLGAGISMDGNGFRGGTYLNSNGTCLNAAPSTLYFYDKSSTGFGQGAQKGEGVAAYVTAKDGGKGTQANGGGGGNNHNAGGGGGSMLSAGGNGGNNTSSSGCVGSNPGIGGKAQNASGNRIFMGGGGGAGHGNNFVSGVSGGTSGANGGGVIYIAAGAIEGGSNTISANGSNASMSISDGAGGGGAGGTIILDISTYNGSLTASVAGGNGGDSDSEGFNNRCFGTGGGGSGGVIYFSNGSTPGGVTTVVNGGTKGNRTNSTKAGCVGSTAGETDGSAGSTSTSFAKIQSSSAFVCTLLPVVISAWTATTVEQGIQLNWQTVTESNFDHFEIQRKGSINGEYITIKNLTANGSNNSVKDYTYLDANPIIGTNYYRLAMVDLDGSVRYTDQIAAIWKDPNEFESLVFPNPSNGNSLNIQIDCRNRIQQLKLQVLDYTGTIVFEQSSSPQVNSLLKTIDVSHLSSGIYLVDILINDHTRSLQKWIVP